MHYCNWNIADYASHTGHLTPIEDIAYRRMLDLYYLHEKPLPRNARSVAVAIRMAENEDAVRAVLSEFFVRSASGYTNKRADHEIARYREKIQQASNAGRASVQRRLNGRSTDVQRSNAVVVEPTNPKNQEPGTNPPNPPSSSPTTSGGADPDPAPERDPVVALQQALLKTGLRSKLKTLHRGRELMVLAERMGPTGLTPDDVAELWLLAQAKSSDDPGGLLAHWLDENLWRESLDEQRMKAKEHDLARRANGAATADPLKGVYGE
jgi:uncharacterized protein YdaU (DUF1376 family)